LTRRLFCKFYQFLEISSAQIVTHRLLVLGALAFDFFLKGEKFARFIGMEPRCRPADGLN